MDQFVSTHEGDVIAWMYIASIIVLASWENLLPVRHLDSSLRKRWSCNALLFGFGAVCTHLVIPGSYVTFAYLSQQNDWIFFNTVSSLPFWLQSLIALIVLDLVRWFIHYQMHQVHWLWRIHRVHHTDTDFDISTALRFHPIEILLQVLVNTSVILLLGLPAAAVLVYEALILAENFFNHGNIKINGNVERRLRMIIVTPDMHRIHHSVNQDEYNSNYAALFSWWDRLFGTYTDEPLLGREKMVLGLDGFLNTKHLGILHMLVNPFLHRDQDAVQVGSDILKPDQYQD